MQKFKTLVLPNPETGERLSTNVLIITSLDTLGGRCTAAAIQQALIDSVNTCSPVANRYAEVTSACASYWKTMQEPKPLYNKQKNRGFPRFDLCGLDLIKGFLNYTKTAPSASILMVLVSIPLVISIL